MTTDERLSRLEGIFEKLATETTTFIHAGTVSNSTVTSAIGTLSQTIQSIRQAIQSQGAAIHRLDQMVTRFDEWRRGQGPSDGHERES